VSTRLVDESDPLPERLAQTQSKIFHARSFDTYLRCYS
jgi:hypothetical protein